MEAVFIYIAKSTFLMLMFYCAYYFLLRKETFFNSNRWFLLSGLLVSTILPLLTYTKVVWIDAAPTLENFSSNISQITEKQNTQFDWNQVALGIYGIGFLIFIIKLAIDFYSLNAIIKGKKIQQQADFKFVDIAENIAPFSYFEYIVYNSSLYTASELENIIEHEKVHSDQNHTIDVLISRFFSIIFWFNPIVWFYKKAITQNLEFIADSEAAKKLSDKKAYQYTLLKITTHENCVAITNHFYQSLIKKRIVMLNANQSKKRNSWKYYVVVPALAAFVLLFQIDVVAKEKPQIYTSKESNIKSVDVYKIGKNSTDSELNEIKSKLHKFHDITFEVSDVKRNESNLLTSIVVDVKKGKQRAKSVQSSDGQAINEFGVLVITYKNGDKKIGIQTINNSNNKEPKTAISNKLKAKTEKDSNTTTNTKTTTSANTSSTIVTTNEDNTVTKITTGGNSTIVVSKGAKKNVGFQLLVVDGIEMPSSFDMNSIKPDDIESMNVLKGSNAIGKYGDKGADGVIEIETKK
ncbi:TonB-dependent receptor plug domain-containing protein [Flavobacterium sp. 17A]|uniref:TonB-dependent receptor plug domain-containing protein n=1 Tax=Flavobacterium potami TaxID=2872310 RepID=A0A9X1HA98_9FLAO|nr:M56 family metallopeptidase [Flavobacterium potami]MBZ4035027.1 TonB-dependent receptor plug domain-containing protein [Flavobacterium potami]